MNRLKETSDDVIVIQKQRVIKDYAVSIYARVSTSHKAQMVSLVMQVSELTRLVSAHRTWFVADVFIDIASARTGTTRLEFNRMISECETGNLDIILTKGLSYFGCDVNEGSEAIRKIQSSGKKIIFGKDKIDTDTKKIRMKCLLLMKR